MDRYLILGHSGFVGGRIIKFYRDNYREIDVLGVSSKDIDLTNLENTFSLKNKF
ncbi:uncharacterized protein METZ01_LOCUS338690, partial [marine metagenome]